MGDFRKLQVWRKAHELALTSHRIAAKMRGAGSSPLRNQFLRSAISIPANIVEGSAKSSDHEFARFLKIAIGSTSELEYHAILGKDTGRISADDFDSVVAQLTDVRKMLSGLLARLRTANPRHNSRKQVTD